MNVIYNSLLSDPQKQFHWFKQLLEKPKKDAAVWIDFAIQTKPLI